MMDKYHSTQASNEQRKKYQADKVLITRVYDNIVSVDYPCNVELNQDFFKKQDKLIQDTYHRFHSRLPQLIIQLDGVSDLSSSCKMYTQSEQHQKLYDAAAFILSKGNMSVLERHYLEQLLADQLQNRRLKKRNNYPVGIFSDKKSAENWLASRPGSHYRH